MIPPSSTLPSDVWLDVIHLIGEDKRSLKSLSSANTSLRNLTLPALFHTIQLVVPLNSPEPETLDAAQEQLIQRVEGIKLSPHISGFVRCLKLAQWEPSIGRCILLTRLTLMGKQGPLVRRTAFIYQLIIDLIAILPRLHRLELKDCRLTPGSLDAIFRSTSLESLRLNRWSKLLIPGTTIDLTPSKVHTLEYCPAPHKFGVNDNVITSFFHQTNHFTVLCLPLSDTPLLLYNQTGNLLRLQKLTIFRRLPYDAERYNEEMIYNLLALTPDLRELHLTGGICSNSTLSILPNTIVPRLESLTATSLIANCIAPGRVLKTIHILAFPENSSYNVVMKEVTKVSYDSMLVDSKKEFSHLSDMFPNALTLRITAVRQCETTHEEICDAILSALPKFSRLRKCRVFDTGRCPTDMNRDRAYCPVGLRDNPTYSSHPTIQDLQILSWFRWRWIPEDGWRLVAVKYSPTSPWDNDNVFLD